MNVDKTDDNVRRPGGPGGAHLQSGDLTAPVVLDARVLLQGKREATLVLDGEPYRLRITQRDKLILTK